MSQIRTAVARRRRAPGLGVLVAGLAAALALDGATARAAAPPALVVADVQVREVTAERQYVVHVRSTAAQPFDVLASPAGVVRVRLHGAQLGAAGESAAADFGRVSLEEEPGGGAVVLRVDLADPAYRVRVGQGGNASVVELRISR